MKEELFKELLKGVKETGRYIKRRERQRAAGEVTAKQARERTGLSQAKFAELIDVPVGTIKNWEQSVRKPRGAALSLLRAIKNDPVHVIKALNE